MSVKIKLQRRGRKKQPVYRIVIQDSRTSRDGKVIDIVGQYNPLEAPKVLVIDDEKIKKWLGNGAQPTEAVARLLVTKGYLEAKVYPKKKKLQLRKKLKKQRQRLQKKLKKSLLLKQ